MNADSHLLMTYTILRVAGMKQEDAWLAAYCAETIDINIFEITIPFADGTTYTPKRTFLPTWFQSGVIENFEMCHVFDTDQMFHFVIPGAPINGVNQLTTPANDLEGNITNQTIEHLMYEGCKPQPYRSTAGKGLGTDLYTFGCILHMLADTFSHQQFYGNKDKRNVPVSYDGLPLSFEEKAEANTLYEMGLDEGHGQLMHLPDAPMLQYSWQRKVEGNPSVKRDNALEWKKSFIAIYRFARYYLNGCQEVPEINMPDELLGQFVQYYEDHKALYRTPRFTREQFDAWYQAIESGRFIDCDGKKIQDNLPEYNEIDIWWNCFQHSSERPMPERDKPHPEIYAGEIKLYNDAFFQKEKFHQTDMYKFWSAVDRIYDWMVAYYKSLGIDRPACP